MEFQDEIETGLQRMLTLNSEFLKSNKGSKAVRKFLECATQDKSLLLRFLRGRKYNAKYAWETLKRHAEVKFDLYPEVFPETLPENARNILKNGEMFGVLKSRDNLGRRILFFNMAAWDTRRYSGDEVNMAIVHVVQKLMEDEDCIKNGVVLIPQFRGSEIKHAREFTLYTIHRGINIYCHSFPLTLKEVHIANMSNIFCYVIRMITYFAPKKIQKRISVSASDLDFSKLKERAISLDNLPKCLGGKLDINEAVDKDFFRC